MIFEKRYVTLIVVITKLISFVRALNELCTNQTMFCYAEGYKPVNIYSLIQSLQLEFCLKKCARDKMCKVAAYSEMVKISDCTVAFYWRRVEVAIDTIIK